MASADVLHEIPNTNLEKLVNLYEQHVKWAPHVLTLIHTAIRLKSTSKYGNCVTFLTPDGPWEDGTIVALFTFHRYDIFIFTLNEDYKNLRQALISTYRINYNNPLTRFFCVHEKHIPLITQVAKEKKLKMSLLDPLIMYALPPNKSNFVINPPSEVYLKKLEPSLAKQIDSVWPHKFPGSENYVTALIEMNGGYGLFLRSTGQMVSWVIKNCFGHIGMLQTEEEYKKRGYGVVVLKALAKEIAEDGNWPFGTVFDENEASIHVFEKLGFERVGYCTYISVQSLC